MNLFTAQTHGADLAAAVPPRSRDRPHAVPRPAPPRRPSDPRPRPPLRSPRRLAGYADRLEPTPVRPAWRGRAAARNVN
jgi:hypothetical protein